MTTKCESSKGERGGCGRLCWVQSWRKDKQLPVVRATRETVAFDQGWETTAWEPNRNALEKRRANRAFLSQTVGAVLPLFLAVVEGYRSNSFSLATSSSGLQSSYVKWAEWGHKQGEKWNVLHITGRTLLSVAVGLWFLVPTVLRGA